MRSRIEQIWYDKLIAEKEKEEREELEKEMKKRKEKKKNIVKNI
jgi:hypothetical protein